MGHEKRAHALLSASSAHRWLVCTPSARLEEQFPDTESGAAREGTLAHELAELKLRNYFFTVDFGKTKLARAIGKLKKEELWNDEMMGYTDTYLDYVKSTALGFKNIPTARIEARIEFDAWVPEGFGTPERLSKRERATSVFPFKLPNPFPAFCHKVILTGRFFCRRFLRRVDRVKIYFIIHKTFPLLNFY